MASETDFAFDELGNSMEKNYDNALGTSLMDNNLWQDNDISKSIEVLGTSLLDKLGSSLKEDQSKSHDASDISVAEEAINFQDDNMTKKDDVDAFGSSIMFTKPADSNSCFQDSQMENPTFTERTKQYILFHMREDRKRKSETFVNISEIEAQHDADDIPILTPSGNEDFDQATKTLHCRHDMKLETQTLAEISEMQDNTTAEDAPLLDLSDNDQLDQLTEVYPNNVGLRQKDDDQGSTIVNLSDQDNRPQQFTQNSQFPHSSDLGNIENVAMTLVLMYAHEYLRLEFIGKMKNPKEDRHILDCTCLCQYIEKTDKKFRKLVDKNKIIHAKYSSIEHNTKEILDALRL